MRLLLPEASTTYFARIVPCVARGVGVGNAADPVFVVDHVGDGVLLADVDAHVAGVIEQDLVELAPLDLVGVRRLAGHLR